MWSRKWPMFSSRKCRRSRCGISLVLYRRIARAWRRCARITNLHLSECRCPAKDYRLSDSRKPNLSMDTEPVLSQRSTDPEDYQALPRPVAAMAKKFPPGFEIAPHAHARDQLLYAVSGVMRIQT